MLAQTAPLSQVDLKQSYGSENNASRGMMLRRMLPNLLINAVAPFVINILARPHMSAVDALLLASSVPALFTLSGLLWKKRIDFVGVLVVVSLLLSAVFALVFKSPRLLLLQSSAVSGLFGIVMLISLLFPRPVLFYLIRSILTQNDPQRLASFNADWAFPQIRSFYRLLTVVWGCLTVAQVLLLTLLVFTLPISLMLVLGPILNFAVIMPAAHWSMYYFRKNKPIFDQLRQQRDAASAKAAC
jgi:intracellular septation protein A